MSELSYNKTTPPYFSYFLITSFYNSQIPWKHQIEEVIIKKMLDRRVKVVMWGQSKRGSDLTTTPTCLH